MPVKTPRAPARRLALNVLLLFIFAFFGLRGQAAWAKLRVATTVPDLAALVQEIGGPDTQVVSLSLATQDPHWVDARPNLALELSKADMLVVVGLQLEIGWLPNLQVGSRNGKIQVGGPGYVDASQFVTLLGVPTGTIDRSMGDVHPGGNPHYLYDPRSAAKVALGLAERMAALDPAQASTYRANASALVGRIDAARAGWEARLLGLKGRPLVDYHRSWTYVEDWLGFRILTDVEPRPGVPPSPKHVLEVLTQMKASQARLILVEEFYQNATLDQLAAQAGGKVLRMPGGTRFQDGERYLDRMERAVQVLESGL